MIRALGIAGFVVFASPAFAQVSEPLPRFEALEKQQQMAEQREFDNLEANRQRDMTRSALPGSGVSEAERALRGLQYDRARDQRLLELDRDRQRVQRERDLANAALLNARVPRNSSLVVTDPERYILPPAPPGKYYARVEGRFVLVDETSQLVTSVLPVQPTDPTADVPAGPRPLPDTGLPVRRISPTSASVVRDFQSLSLPAPPSGQYYASVDGRIVLVDGRTELAVRLVDPG
ncbi:MAG TPA: RcnB family protein [Hyphomonadaceae bacterium]|nr:RcnB family protein [Hyphomonadaceae bacterium]HPI46796.1 RcnB family protein [Hyphomonadaceae bacterium]